MIMANMLSKYMNKQEMAEYIVNVFQNYEAYYKEHLEVWKCFTSCFHM